MIDKLAYLVAVARERNFRRAAESCGVAQPTLSAGIKQLEDELGAMLVQRSSRFLGLTPEGEKVLEWARRLVGDARSMRQELQSMRAGLSGHLRIAVIPTALAMLPMLTNPCLARHPALRFTILSSPSVQILKMIEDLEVDAGITYLDNEALGRVQAVALFAERYTFITTEGGPFGDRATVTWAELGQAKLCLLTPDMQNRRIIDRLLRGAGVQARAVLESNSQITLLAHVLTGQWASILPEQVVATLATALDQPQPLLRRIAITEPSATFEVGLVVQHREPMPVLAAALLAEARLLARHRPP